MGFVLIRKAVLDRCAGQSQSLAMDLHDQHVYMERTGQWRFTPPTHVVAALGEAIDQFVEQGGQPARLSRYTENCKTLIDGMAALGFVPFLKPELQAPIIVTFHAPGDRRYDFKTFYQASKRRGFILYPGKLTQVETFRVGCIGAIGINEMRQGRRRGRRHAARDGDRERCAGTLNRREIGVIERAPSTETTEGRWQRAQQEHPALQAVRGHRAAQGEGRPSATSTDPARQVLHKDKFFGAAQPYPGGGLRLLRRGVSAGTAPTSATTTRRSPVWLARLSDALRAARSVDDARVPWDGEACRSSSANSSTRRHAIPGVPAPDPEARPEARPRSSAWPADVRRWSSSGSTSPRRRRAGRRSRASHRSRSRRACSATRCCA
jgi:hypothetical protein